ncbi:MAG: peptidoglycan-binding protein LysM, partial [Aquaticitalea sp.]
AKAKDAGNEVKAELEAARKLEKTIKDLKLKVEKLIVVVDDDQVTVTGKAKDQSTKEKVVLLLGNVNGIATVDDQMSVEHEVPESKFYTVVKGDTLNKIAKHYYRDANKNTIIFEANQPMLTDASLIYPGQVLRIPRLD